MPVPQQQQVIPAPPPMFMYHPQIPPPPAPPSLATQTQQPNSRYQVGYGPPTQAVTGYYDMYGNMIHQPPPPHPVYISQVVKASQFIGNGIDTLMQTPAFVQASTTNNPTIYQQPLEDEKKLREEMPHTEEERRIPYTPMPVMGPPSALPSQFAYNLPSPSTYYPEFYYQQQHSQNELLASPSGVGGSFYWPNNAASTYKSSPLSKM